MSVPLYKPGDILYYVNPFVFVIDKVLIEFVDEVQNGERYYVDHSGAYLTESSLSPDLLEAKLIAQARLQAFYVQKDQEIKSANPELDITEDD